MSTAILKQELYLKNTKFNLIKIIFFWLVTFYIDIIFTASQYDNIEAVEGEVFLHEQSNPPTEAVDISNHVYYELSSSGLIDDNTASLTENISAEESANEYQHVSTTGQYDVLSLRNKLDPMNTNVLRLYPERPRDAYHVVNVSYLKEVNNLEDFETNSVIKVNKSSTKRWYWLLKCWYIKQRTTRQLKILYWMKNLIQS